MVFCILWVFFCIFGLVTRRNQILMSKKLDDLERSVREARLVYFLEFLHFFLKFFMNKCCAFLVVFACFFRLEADYILYWCSCLDEITDDLSWRTAVINSLRSASTTRSRTASLVARRQFQEFRFFSEIIVHCCMRALFGSVHERCMSLQFEEGRKKFDGKFTVDEIKNFIRMNSVALLSEPTQESPSKIPGGDIKSYNFLFIPNTDNHFQVLQAYLTTYKFIFSFCFCGGVSAACLHLIFAFPLKMKGIYM